MNILSLDVATEVVQTARKKAQELSQPVSIAIVDAGGNPIIQIRMDGARIGSVDIALNKAWTARAFDIETAALSEFSQPGGPFYGIHVSNGGRVMLLAGGIPLLAQKDIVGAIGVSGGSGEDDSACARAGADALARLTQ